MRWILVEDEVEHEIVGEIDLDDLDDLDDLAAEYPWLNGEAPSDTCEQDAVDDEEYRRRFLGEIPDIDPEDLDEQYLAAEERWLARLAVEG